MFTRIGLIEPPPQGIRHILSLPIQKFQKVFGFLIFQMDLTEKVWVQVKNIDPCNRRQGGEDPFHGLDFISQI